MRFIKVLAIALCLLVFAACGSDNKGSSGGSDNSDNGRLDQASFPNEDATIYGAWERTEKDQSDNGTYLSYRIYFNRNEIGMALDCEFSDGKVVTAVATVAGVYGHDEFTAKQSSVVSAKDTRGGRSYSCTMHTLPADMKVSYNVSNDNLRLFFPNGRDYNLVRIR